MKKFLSTFCFILLTSLILCSCKSKEEKAIDRLKELTEKIEKNSSNWDMEQWSEALGELEKMQSELNGCNFTEEQLKELGQVEGQLTTIMIQGGGAALGNSVESYLNEANSFMEGFQDGIQESKEETVEEIENYINSTIDELMDSDDSDN